MNTVRSLGLRARSADDPAPSIAPRTPAGGLAVRALGRLIFRIDDHLRARQGVVEFTGHPRAIFRLRVRALDQDVVLVDGTRAGAGERIADLHLWNEQLPILRGDSLAWARQMNRCLDLSLRELARHLAGRGDLDDVAAIRADMGFGTADQLRQLARIAGRYGFEAVADRRELSKGRRLHRLGENVLISLMVLARNGEALRPDTLARSRVQVFLSRHALMRRYAGSEASAA